MCPSYRGTREERHSTRGRAHLLQEMLVGDPLTSGWGSDAVHEALDLCLACKACRSECPVQVDMATYKAEFMYHYYRGKRRWARLAGRAPGLANALTDAPALAGLAKWVAGIHPDRRLPRFATPFRKAWSPRLAAANSGPRVILFSDTFNGYFTPAPLHAAAEVLEAAGCRVELPEREVCCGRPLFDFGFLDEARANLASAVQRLHGPLSARAWLVGIEAACLATFKDELLNFFPDDERARTVAARTRLFGDFLANELEHWEPPQIDGPVQMHGHCNHKAIFGMDGDETCLQRAGADVEITDSCWRPGQSSLSRLRWRARLQAAFRPSSHMNRATSRCWARRCITWRKVRAIRSCCSTGSPPRRPCGATLFPSWRTVAG